MQLVCKICAKCANSFYIRMNDTDYLLNCLIAELKKKYQEHPDGGNSNPVKWATTAFKGLTKIMGMSGYHIGERTIRSIMTGSYIISDSTSKINTLNTIVQFLEYENWNEFVRKAGEPTALEKLHCDAIYRVISEAHKKVWKAKQLLPVLKISLFTDYFIKDASYYKKTCSDLFRLSSYEAQMKHNSTHLLDTATIKWITDKKACVVTHERECVEFNWKPIPGTVRLRGIYEFKMDGTSEHIDGIPNKSRNYAYLLINIGGNWKIAGKWSLGHRTYEDAKADILVENQETGERSYVYPEYHEKFQSLYFPDSDEFQLEYEPIERFNNRAKQEKERMKGNFNEDNST